MKELTLNDLFLEPRENKTGIDIEQACKHYNANFLGHCYVASGDAWLNVPGLLFWQHQPPHDYHNFMSLFVYDKLYVQSGLKAANATYEGLVARDGSVIYSTYRHDFYSHPRYDIAIDGGPDYRRIVGSLDIQYGTCQFTWTKDGPKFIALESLNEYIKDAKYGEITEKN